MPAKFAGLRVSSGDVMAFYGPCGGYGDPLDRPAEQMLEDVLDESRPVLARPSLLPGEEIVSTLY